MRRVRSRTLIPFLFAASFMACTTTGDGVDASVELPPCTKPRLHVHTDWIAFFDTGSSELTRPSRVLDDLVALWRRNGGSFIEVEGHMDAAEAKTFPPSLAADRADAVKRYLIAGGIPAGRIVVEAYGANRPLVPVDGAEPQNRRAFLIPRIFAPRGAQVAVLECRIWVRDHCFTPSRLAKAGAGMCNKVMDAAF